MQVLSRFYKLIDNNNKKYLNLKFIDDIDLRRIFKLLIILFLALHLFSCFFVTLGELTSFEYNTWIKKYYLNSNSSSLYLTSLYFHFVTVLTVGYGDITMTNQYEKLYCILFMIMGISFYSLVVSYLSDVFFKLDANAQRYNNYKEYLDELSASSNINEDLYFKTEIAINFLCKEKVSGVYEMIEDLPYTLKSELLYIINKEKVDKFVFFKEKSKEFINFVLPLLCPMKVRKGDVLFTAEDLVEEMVNVSNGMLSINLGKEFNFIEVYELRKNDHFGEIMMYNIKPSPYELKCKSNQAELFMLSKENFMQIKARFEGQILMLLEVSLKKIKQIKLRQVVLIELFCYEQNKEKIYQMADKIDYLYLQKNFEFAFNNDVGFEDCYNMEDFFKEYDQKTICQRLGIIRFNNYAQVTNHVYTKALQRSSKNILFSNNSQRFPTEKKMRKLLRILSTY